MKNAIYLLTFIFLFLNCKTDAEFQYYDGYLLDTEIIENNSNGILVKGVLLETGDEPITEKGFIVKRNYDYRYVPSPSPEFLVSEYIVSGDFELYISSDLDSGSICEIRPYLKTTKSIYYGINTSVKVTASPPPCISRITPQDGNLWQTLTIEGSGFSTIPSRNNLYIHGIKYEIKEASENSLIADPVLNLGPSYPEIVVEISIGESDPVLITKLFTFEPLLITSIQPEMLIPGTVFEIELNKELEYITGDLYVYTKDGESDFLFPLNVLGRKENKISCFFSYDQLMKSLRVEIIDESGVKQIAEKDIRSSNPIILKNEYPREYIPFGKTVLTREYIYSSGYDVLYRFDFKNDSWDTFYLPDPLIRTALFDYNGDIYIGGKTGDFFDAVSKLWKFNEYNGAITEIKLPSNLDFIDYSPDIYKIENKIFIYYHYYGTLYCYLPDKEQWEIISLQTSLPYNTFIYNDNSYYIHDGEVRKFNFPDIDDYEYVYFLPSPYWYSIVKEVEGELYLFASSSFSIFVLKWNFATGTLVSLGSIRDIPAFMYHHNNRTYAGVKGYIWEFSSQE